MERKAFFTNPKHECHHPNEMTVFVAPNHEKKRFLLAFMFDTIDGIMLILKNSGKKSISYQTKASMSSIPIRRMCLWCLIMKKSRLIRASMFPMTGNIILSPKNGGKKNFSY